jgi:hypothetical protein
MKLSQLAVNAAREAYYQSLASQMAGGRLELYTAEGTVLVRVPFPNDVAIASGQGFTIHDIPEQEVEKVGDPAKFAVLSSDGKVIVEGTAGFGINADMDLEEKHQRLFPGMKFGIPEFTYTNV